ncbi:MAG: ABC transporter ATP-binding protein [Phycisphaerae bacterium]|nr:ABC transporter ATP-binding protein [Phycisphaerae bacterium]
MTSTTPTAAPLRAAVPAPAPPTPLLRVEGLGVSFDNGAGPRIRAVDGAAMSVFPGQTLAVVGESGCGKSVTAMSALQLIPRPPGRFDSGHIYFRTARLGASGTPIRADAERGEREVDLLGLPERDIRAIRGNEIAMIFQEPMTSLNPVYTVGDQIVEAVLLHQPVGPSEAAEIARQAMADVGIPDPARRMRAYPHQFSGGMRQRVMIAMALACRPRLLLADEPTTALDVTIQAQILELLRRLQRERGMAVMLITHALGVVAENADVVCVMYAGRVVEYAPVLDLFDRPLHPYTRGLLTSIPRMGARRDRLVTIREVVDDESQFTGLGTGLRPWWPWHDPPLGVAGGQSCLVEVEPAHFVGVWRTESAAARAAGGAPCLPHLAQRAG